MHNLLALWNGLTWARRLVLAGATVGVFVAILGLSRLGSGSDQSLLYAGLDAQAAGQVIAALDQSTTPYEVRGDAIYVASSSRDSLRMQLAAQGLPASGGQGYELLDGLSGFGTTSQMFDAAYWRAKEGELARTALAMPNVRMARVHIAAQQSNSFQRDRKITASISVTMSTGSISKEQAEALRHLIASSVGQMQAMDVAVIDANSGVVAAVPDPIHGGEPDQRAEAIRRNIERMLEARVGAGKAVVEVHLDIVRDREAIKERKIDPQGRVALSSDSESQSEMATQPSGDVTVASNLPDGDAAAGEQGKSQSSSNRERVNFDVSETQREVIREPGSIRRMTIAVLVDGALVPAADGTVQWQPRPDQEMADLRELVAAAAGVDETRGDVLSLKSMEFQPVEQNGNIAEAGFLSAFGPINTMSLIQFALLSLIALGLMLFVIRPLLESGRRANAGAALLAGQNALPPPKLAASGLGGDALTGEIADDDDPQSIRFLSSGPAEDQESAKPDPVERLKRLIDSRQQESVEILRGWLEQHEEHP